jgi:putative copper export protein/mono/diheme cytochrome c family protein/peroxiredoxin
MTGIAFFRGLFNSSAILLFGTLIFLSATPKVALPEVARLRGFALRSSALFSVLCLVAAAGFLLTKTAELNGGAIAVLDPRGWQNIASTRFGRVWIARGLVALALAGFLVGKTSLRRPVDATPARTRPLFLVAASVLAGVGLALGALAGHGAALEPRWPFIALHMVHLLAAGAWVGGLPALILTLSRARSCKGNQSSEFAADSLARFSPLASVMVALIVSSGLVLTYWFTSLAPAHVDLRLTWPDPIKLALLAPLVAVAWHVRWRLFPLPPRAGGDTVARSPNWLIVALLSVLALLLLFIARASLPPLIGTLYGRLILAKGGILLLILLLAGHVRWYFLPRLLNRDGAEIAPISRWVIVECLLGLVIVVLGSVAAETTPAAHEQIAWPLAFRISLEANWDDPAVRQEVYLGAAMTFLGALWGMIGWIKAPLLRSRMQPEALTTWGAGITIAVGLLVALPPIVIPAYPDTYRRSSVPFEAASIVNGIAVYRANCVPCHGESGRGDGPLGKGLSTRPANLTEPHTALHTGGDIFWWLTHGIPGKPMPGFSASIPEEARWDVINFLRALSAGYQARIIGEQVVPNRPWLGAPDFSFSDKRTDAARLSDLRGKKTVLLVIFSWPNSRARLEALRDRAATLSALGVEIIAAPGDEIAAKALDSGALESFLFSVIAGGSIDVASAYALLGRTLRNAGEDVSGLRSSHCEFLIDRSGYIRARWNEPLDARSSTQLETQIVLLNREAKVFSPPDDHMH